MGFQCCCTAYQACVWIALLTVNSVGYVFSTTKVSEFASTAELMERSAIELVFLLAMDALVIYTTPSDDPPASAGDCSPQRAPWYRRYSTFVWILLIIATVCGTIFYYLKESEFRSTIVNDVFSALEIVCCLSLDAVVVINMYKPGAPHPSLEQVAFSVI